MFVDVLFSFQRTSCHLVLATLLVYHVCLFLSNTFKTFLLMVTRTGFEPVYACVKGMCVKPLHQRAIIF